MTSTIYHQQPTSTSNTTTMNWTNNEKISLNCIDNIGLRQLWKLIALNSRRNSNKNENISSSTTLENNNNTNNNIEEILSSHRDFLPSNKMSLLKFLAINALELSAPAAPVLLQQGNNKPKGWVQLSGHPESIVPTSAGIVRKRVTSDTDPEVKAYEFIKNDSYAINLIPNYYGYKKINGESYIELEDLLDGFIEPNVMDIKLGCRTFLESEVTNDKLRTDLYKKMITVDINGPTELEHQLKAITKLRYMEFREKMSSSHTKGFRIEALRICGGKPITDLKTIKHDKQIEFTINKFLNNKYNLGKDLIKRLHKMRSYMEKSEFFHKHEIVGSSIFIVYDDYKYGIWLIDFAKSRELPNNIKVTHRKEWIPGNREEGLLKGMDELIKVFENVCENLK